MNLSFQASPDGFLKIDKDGCTILTIKPSEDFDIQKLACFHLRPYTSLHVLGAKKDIVCTGFVREISIKSEISIKFQVSDKIDLNAVYDLCCDPEPWQVRLADEQTQLAEYEIRRDPGDKAVERAKVMNEAQELIAVMDEKIAEQNGTVKAEYHGTNKVLGLAADMVNAYGVDGAKNVLAAAQEAKKRVLTREE